ncbi:hypothetical protein JOD54_002177 [Actinokineospora baliensis]|nr:hypothetical protein [Actinokineospora baliensis]
MKVFVADDKVAQLALLGYVPVTPDEPEPEAAAPRRRGRPRTRTEDSAPVGE